VTCLFTKPGPRPTREFKRILDLPQRNAERLGEKLAEVMTEDFRVPGGDMTLRPLQALALAEATDFGGAVVLLPVGQGKTLVSYLLPTVTGAKRPLLLVPGKLIEKTRIEFRELESQFRAPENLTIWSYEYLSTHPGALVDLEPDLIIADEAHKLKNTKAACTKRVWRYYKEHEPMFVPMSGTLAKRSFFDWWHLQLMALPKPLWVLPDDWKQAEMWAAALDEKTRNRAGLGALSAFGSTLQEARAGFGAHLKAVPGIIAADTVDVEASLVIEVVRARPISVVQDALDRLEDYWTLPDGTELSEASEKWRHEREIANGFYYRWAEQPPQAWREARTDFNRFVRDVLHGSRTFTAPSEVVEAHRTAAPVERWFSIKDSFKPRTEAVWLSNAHVFEAARDVHINGGLLWYEHKAVGEKIKEWVPVFGSHGRELSTGESLVEFKGKCAAVSVGACSEGFNLQRFDRNIVLNCTPTGDRWEQMLGRTHRAGQESDEVTVEVWTTAPQQIKDFKQALADARYIEGTTGQRQKLSYADVIGLD
jgi:hypothetical protein